MKPPSESPAGFSRGGRATPESEGRALSGDVLFYVVSAGLALLMGTLCAVSFLDYPVLDRRTSVLMEADTNDYVAMLLGSRWRGAFGSAAHTALEWEELRKVLHHVAYFPIAEGIIHLVQALTTPLGGVSRRTAIYAINAVLTAVNVQLIAVLLRRLTPRASFAWVLLYACSLSTWVYGGLPDTWVLSGTFVLLTILMASRGIPLAFVSALVGLFMLNNFTLAHATLALVPRVAMNSSTPSMLARRAAAAFVPAIVVWLIATWTLATSQPLFQFAEFMRITTTFQHTWLPEPRSLLSPIRWGVAFVLLFVLSVVNQDSLDLSMGAVLRTLASPPLGTLGLLLLLSTFALGAYRFAREANRATSVRAFASGDHIGCALILLATYALGTLGIYVDITIQAPVAWPVLVLLLARYVGTATPATRALVWVLTGVVLVGTLAQIAHVRTVLGTL